MGAPNEIARVELAKARAAEEAARVYRETLEREMGETPSEGTRPAPKAKQKERAPPRPRVLPPSPDELPKDGTVLSLVQKQVSGMATRKGHSRS